MHLFGWFWNQRLTKTPQHDHSTIGHDCVCVSNKGKCIAIPPKSWGYCHSITHNTPMCWMKLMISIDIILMTFRQQINPQQNSFQLVRWTQLQHELVKGQLTEFTKSSFSSWAAKGLQSNWEPLQASNRAWPLWRWRCHGLGIDHRDWEDRTPHLPGERHWALLQRQCYWAYCCALSPPVWECIHLSRWHCKSPSCTCYPKSSAVSQNQDSPMTSEVPRPVFHSKFEGCTQETCLEMASQVRGHQQAR